MLRQQADRIAELEKLLEHSVGSDCREMRYIQEIENKDARIAELEKNLHMIQRHYDQLNTQTKPLSDEEITEIAEKTLGHSMGLLNWMGFARAITEKHGIK